MNKIVIIDYGVGNLRSVAQALRYAAPEADVIISGEPNIVRSADRLVLPGQGAMHDCMNSLHQSGLYEEVLAGTRSKPMLGVCVGQQMLFDSSEESISTEKTQGLGLLAGKVIRFRLQDQLQADGSRYKVPQIGWNRVKQKQNHALWTGILDNSFFYFVHSFYVTPEHTENTAATTEYGVSFTSAVVKDNIFATQFHPEKSAEHGLKLYQNFAQWQPK